MRSGRSFWLVASVVALAAGCGSGQSDRDTTSRGGTANLGGTGGASAGTGGSGAGKGGTTGGTAGADAGTGGASASAGTGGASAGNGGLAAGTGGTATGSGGTAAGSGGASAGSGGTNAGSGGMTAGSGGAPPLDPSAELYDPEKLPRFDLELPEASVDALNLVTGPDDDRQNVYVTATLRYGGETVSNIGLRIKGESSFQKLDGKPPLKLKFDEFVPMQEFRGLRRMSLNNLFEDPSFIAERLAYDVYRAAGVPAPRCNSALVYINDTFYGVYTNIEAEDKTFLRRWFANEDGNLYEEGQEDFVPGAETAFNLETNETANDRTDLSNLIAVVQAATDPATFLADIGTVIDVPRFLKFTALEAAVNQWDMYAYTVFWVNNFRLYSDPDSGKFHFIPWGHDLSMKPYRDSDKPFIRLFELARQYDMPNRDVTSGLLFQRCLESPACVSAYRRAVEEVITVYDDLELEATATRYYDQIKASVMMDTRKNVCCDSMAALTNAEFEAGYQSVLSTVRGRTAALRADLEQ